MKKTIVLGLWFFFVTGSAYSDDEIKIDWEFSDRQQEIIRTDLAFLKSLSFNHQDSWFGKIFKGDVHKYLIDRVRYLVSAQSDLTDRVIGGPYFPPPGEVMDSDGKVIAALAAYNIGTELFFVNMKYFADYRTFFEFRRGFIFGNERLPFESTRTGLIELGPRYFEKLNPELPNSKIPTSRFERISFLIHEARHSDCTGGLSSQDLEKVMRGQPIANRLCGYEHILCPTGHKYAGVGACEDIPWGSYAVETSFLAAVLVNCTNCSGIESQEINNLLLDRKSRVLNWSSLYSGQLGDPDMTSGGPPWNP
jgi:hypothetical protein